MANKKKQTLFDRIINLVSVFASISRVTEYIKNLVYSEIRLAKRKIILLLIMGLLFGVLLVSIWLCLLAILILYLMSLQLGLLFSLTIVLSLNILLLVIVGLFIYVINAESFFPETRQLLTHFKKDLLR